MLTNSVSRQAFDTTYETIFQKVLVAMKVASTRLEPMLTFGQTLKRVRFDITSVPVRALNDNADYTIDTVSDTSELITINKNNGLVFHVSDLTKIQSGALRPEQVIGFEMAKKVARYVDGDTFAEVKNAAYTFDNGDLTTAISSGTPITLTTAVVPQFVTQSQAKLRANNIDVSSGTCFVVDPYVHSIVSQYLIGKNNNMSVGEFENGYEGNYLNSEVYVSTNLTADVKLTWAANPTAGQTLTIGGTTFTFVAALTAVAGQVLIGGSRAVTLTNLTDAIAAGAARVNTPASNPTGSGTEYVEFTSTALYNLADLRMSVTSDAANVTTITSIGGGRLNYATTMTGGTFANVLHIYFGKRGAIDVVAQDKIEAEVVKNPYRFGDIVRSRTVYGIKTFIDGAQQMLDVQLLF